jgi:hypothetical protein
VGCKRSPELRDPREGPCPSVARLIARESAARAQRSNCFALIAGLAVRSYWSCASAFGRTAGTATDPITARETPAQHARTSFGTHRLGGFYGGASAAGSNVSGPIARRPRHGMGLSATICGYLVRWT